MVMIVDDREESRFLMGHFLRNGGAQVVEAAGGNDALTLLDRAAPDVIVIDVYMPGMNGFDLCRAIRARAETTNTPVILVSSLADRERLAEGFAVGAVDFLAKPVRPEELCARVAVHVQLSRARRELEASNARLAAMNREKDMMFGVATHDLRGPVSVIMGFAENTLGHLPEGARERGALEIILREARQMEHFLSELLDLEVLERGRAELNLVDLDLVDAARQALQRVEPSAERKSMETRLVAPATPLRGRGDSAAVRRILDNLLSNAIKFTPAGGRVMVRVAQAGDEIQCVVMDSGPGLTSADMDKVFGRFARLSARPTSGEKSVGLGLAICRALITHMGGRVWCGNNPEGGAFFAFAIPPGVRSGGRRGAPGSLSAGVSATAPVSDGSQAPFAPSSGGSAPGFAVNISRSMR